MRGLAVFISDIRNCEWPQRRTRPAEGGVRGPGGAGCGPRGGGPGGAGRSWARSRWSRPGGGLRGAPGCRRGWAGPGRGRGAGRGPGSGAPRGPAGSPTPVMSLAGALSPVTEPVTGPQPRGPRGSRSAPRFLGFAARVEGRIPRVPTADPDAPREGPRDTRARAEDAPQGRRGGSPRSERPLSGWKMDAGPERVPRCLGGSRSVTSASAGRAWGWTRLRHGRPAPRLPQTRGATGVDRRRHP